MSDSEYTDAEDAIVVLGVPPSPAPHPHSSGTDFLDSLFAGAAVQAAAAAPPPGIRLDVAMFKILEQYLLHLVLFYQSLN